MLIVIVDTDYGTMLACQLVHCLLYSYQKLPEFKHHHVSPGFRYLPVIKLLELWIVVQLGDKCAHLLLASAWQSIDNLVRYMLLDVREIILSASGVLSLQH